jgi:hypothetical protein
MLRQILALELARWRSRSPPLETIPLSRFGKNPLESPAEHSQEHLGLEFRY